MKLKFKDANSEQLDAIESTDGPLLIIAGPGTGKTYTLINRALNLIVNKKVDPSKIMFATFTDKAAHELMTRLSNALDDNGIDFNPNEMYLGTFHSICLKILKEHIEFSNLKKNFSLKDQFDQQYFIYQNLSDFMTIEGFDTVIKDYNWWDKCESIIKIINRLEEELIDADKLSVDPNPDFKVYGKILKKYQQLRLDNNFLDFSSIQTETYKMLLKFDKVLEEVRESIDYIMVDEYQDTNNIQEKLTLLFSKNNNICVVGDDDQAIYRFRGATVRNILQFKEHFDNCKQVSLVKNYRSHKDIVSFYNTWMGNTNGKNFGFDWDKFRYPKKIVPGKSDLNTEKTVIQCSTKEEDYINEKVYLLIDEIVRSGKIKDLNQIAFLFKSVKNDRVKCLADYLESKGIAIYSPRSNMFFDREEIKLFIGTMILMFPNYYMALRKGEANQTVSGYYLSCIKYTESILTKPEYNETMTFVKQIIKDHITVYDNFNYAFSGLAYRLLEHKPFSDFLTVDIEKGVHDTRTTRNVGLFIKVLIKFEFLNGISILTKKNFERSTKNLFDQYFRFLLDGGITEYEDESEYAPSGCVSFLTIHQSKGLEFPIVFVGSQNATPRKQYDEDMEEIIEVYSDRGKFEELEMMKYFDFWRLYYVAFSRAQSLLVMLCDKSKRGEPSNYFEYIYDEIPYNTDFSKYNFEDVKKTSIKNTYSFTTDIENYMLCPTQYKYFKELGFEEVRMGSTLFGTLVHETIEDAHKAVLRDEISTITEDNLKKWFDINYETASKAHNYYLSKDILDSAFEQVLGYVERASKNWSIICNAEMPVSLMKKDYIISGKVDLVTNNKGQYEILDFKTEKKPNLSKEKEKVERVRSQLEVYAYLLEQRYGYKITGMKVYYTSEKDGNPYLPFKRDDKHIKETLKTFDDVVKKIEKKDYSGSCKDAKICRDCDLRFYCRRSVK